MNCSTARRWSPAPTDAGRGSRTRRAGADSGDAAVDVLFRTYARKAIARGRRWEAVAAIERVRGRLTQLRGRRDGLVLDPAEPARALVTVLGELTADYEPGPARRALLGRPESRLGPWLEPGPERYSPRTPA